MEEPPMLIPEASKIPALLANARRGLPLRIVARLSRLRPEYLAKLLAEGDTDDAAPDVIEFTRDYREQEALFIAEQHDTVATAKARVTSDSDPNVGARLALLERMAPEYARGAVAALEDVPAPSNVPARVAELDPEDRAAIRAALERRKGSRQVADVGATNLKRL